MRLIQSGLVLLQRIFGHEFEKLLSLQSTGGNLWDDVSRALSLVVRDDVHIVNLSRREIDLGSTDGRAERGAIHTGQESHRVRSLNHQYGGIRLIRLSATENRRARITLANGERKAMTPQRSLTGGGSSGAGAGSSSGSEVGVHQHPKVDIYKKQSSNTTSGSQISAPPSNREREKEKENKSKSSHKTAEFSSSHRGRT